MGSWPSTIHLRPAEEKQNGFCRYIVTNKVTLWSASFSACVAYTKTIIHLTVGESSGFFFVFVFVFFFCNKQY